MEDVLDLIDQISQLDSDIQVANLGETDYIIDYHRLNRLSCGGSG